jgi:hypothetical protein
MKKETRKREEERFYIIIVSAWGTTLVYSVKKRNNHRDRQRERDRHIIDHTSEIEIHIHTIKTD